MGAGASGNKKATAAGAVLQTVTHKTVQPTVVSVGAKRQDQVDDFEDHDDDASTRVDTGNSNNIPLSEVEIVDVVEDVPRSSGHEVSAGDEQSDRQVDAASAAIGSSASSANPVVQSNRDTSVSKSTPSASSSTTLHSHTQAATPAVKLKPGDKVRICGLENATHLNGIEGTILSWEEQANRWLVRLKSGEEKKVRPANLQRVSNFGPSSSKSSATVKPAEDAKQLELEQLLLQSNWSAIYQHFFQRFDIAALDRLERGHVVRSGVQMTVSIVSKCFALLKSDPGGRLHCTPLHIAALQSSIEAATVIVSQLPQMVEQTHKTSHTALCPLHIAILVGCQPMIELLLDGQADPNVRTLHDVRPLHLAATASADYCTLLLNAKANTNHRDVMGSSPMHYACTFKQAPCAELLMNHSNGNPRLAIEVDQKRTTPLHICVSMYKNDEDLFITMLLIASGARPWHSDISGTSSRDVVPRTAESIDGFFAYHGDNAQSLEEAAQQWLDQRKAAEDDDQDEEAADANADELDALDSSRDSAEGHSPKGGELRRRGKTQGDSAGASASGGDTLVEAKLRADVERLQRELAQSKERATMLEDSFAQQQKSLEAFQKVREGVQAQHETQLEDLQRRHERLQLENVNVLKDQYDLQLSEAQNRVKDLERDMEEKDLAFQAERSDFEERLQKAQNQNFADLDDAQFRNTFSNTFRKAQNMITASHGVGSVGFGGGFGGAGDGGWGEPVPTVNEGAEELMAEVNRLQALYEEEQTLRRQAQTQLQDLKGAIRVICRIRPLSKKELESGDTGALRREDAFTAELRGPRAKNFQFDTVFDERATQEEVFADCRDLIKSALDGFNVTVFAYGQTGSGKTFTMHGTSEEPGLAPRTMAEIFQQVDRERSLGRTCNVKMMLLELYQNTLVDMLSLETKAFPGDVIKSLDVKKDAKGAVLVEGSNDQAVADLNDAQQLLVQGLKKRHVSATKMNADSSRSHLIQILTVECTKVDGSRVQGKIILVDLAGSERPKKSGVTGDALKEAIEINKSLTALGDVIESLTKSAKQVPYRNHKLTMLMQDSLGGTAKTLMFVNCSPASSNADESLMSLNWATRAKEVRNSVIAHADVGEEGDDLDGLEAEAKKDLLAALQAELSRAQRDGSENAQEVQGLQEQIRQLREEIAALRTQRLELEDRLQSQIMEKQQVEAQASEQQITYESRLADIQLQHQQSASQAQGELEEARQQLEVAQAESSRAQPEIERLHEKLRGIEDRFAEEQILRKKFHNQIQDMKGAIRVFCRYRPMVQREFDAGESCIVEKTDAFTVEVVKAGRGSAAQKEETKAFAFDAVFSDQSTQEEVFADCKDLVCSAVDGYNVTIFAYGQTGAGKTHTMYGSQQQPGLAPRTIEELFKIVRKEEATGRKKFNVRMYMVELYKQNLVDLLADDVGKPALPKDPKQKDKKTLDIKRNMQTNMMYIENVTEKSVSSPQEMMQILALGEKQRHVTATKMNSASSRSHLLCSIIVESTELEKAGQVMYGKITLCDLAGSERPKKSGVEGDALKEAVEINKSLSALGDVISSLTSKKDKNVPYRNHKLTMLMQDSIGGSAKTLMFVNVSPAASNTEETIMSLQWASRAKQVTNDVKRNTDNKEVARLKQVIAQMSAEIAHLNSEEGKEEADNNNNEDDVD